MKTFLSFLICILAASAFAADGYLTVTNGTTIGGAAGGGGAGDVTQAGQNNFSGSNYFGSSTTFAAPPLGNGSGLTNLNVSTATGTKLGITNNGVYTLIDSNTITGGTMTLSGTGTNYFGADVNVNGTVNATGYTNSGLTASRLILSDANKAEVSAAASGAVPVDADGSAATFAQINALAPSFVITNNESQSVTFSNNFAIDATHTNTVKYILGVGAINMLTDTAWSDRQLYGVNWVLNKDTGFNLIANATAGGAGRINAAAIVSTATITATNGFLIPTNYVAANFTPVAGKISIVVSNRVIYGVSDTKTNVLLNLE